MTEQVSPLKQQDIFCNECEVIRFMMGIHNDHESKPTVLCQRCLQGKAQEKKSRSCAITQSQPIYAIKDNLANKLEQKTFVIKSTSIDDAAAKIGRNDPNFVVARLVLPLSSNNDSSNSIPACNRLLSSLAANTHLKILNVHIMVGLASYEQAAIAIAQGLAINSSIKRVTWRISTTATRATSYCSDSTGSVKLALALHKMVESNSVMTSFRLKSTTNCRGLNRHIMEKNRKSDDAFVEPILQGLKRNAALQVLRLDGYANETDEQRMELLLACNRERWLQRLTNANASVHSRVSVLEEALALPRVEPVSAAYHLLRKCPDLISHHNFRFHLVGK